MQRLVPGSLRHLQPHAEVAERVLVPGDPGRALRIAQWLLERPRMLNHHRGLWGYTGTAADGAPLTVQSAGMGGASTAIVVHELIALGARRLVRVGTCEALASGVALGDLLIVREAVARDGTSRGLNAPERLRSDAALTEDLLAAAGLQARAGTVLTTDVFFAPTEARDRAAGAEATDLETAAFLAVATQRGATAGCVLAVTGLGPGEERIEADGLAAAEEAMGRIAAAALS
jgi:uridine phosphorylase